MFKDHFSQDADRYANARPHYPSSLFEFLASIVPSTERAWDCATGNGQAAIGLASYFDEVFASDASAEQITHALPHDRVAYSIQPVERTDFPSLYFDLITAAQALHWFDFDHFYLELDRLLKPGGIFAAWGYAFFSISPQVDQAVDKVILGPIEPYWAEENRLLWEGYRSIPFPLDAVAAPTFEIRCRWNLHELLDYVGTWSAMSYYAGGQKDQFLETAQLQLVPAWGDPSISKAVRMKLHLRVGRKAAP